MLHLLENVAARKCEMEIFDSFRDNVKQAIHITATKATWPCCLARLVQIICTRLSQACQSIVVVVVVVVVVQK